MLAPALNRLKSSSSTSEPTKPEPDINEALEKAGYPLRHRSHLAAMTGEGLSKAKELLPLAMARDCLILRLGNRGPGKTQIATWLAAERKRAGKSCGTYIKCADLIGKIKATWADGGKSVGTEEDVLRHYRKIQFLVIDELHEKGASDWESRTLINILDHRYDAMLSTILIANMTEATAQTEINPSILSRAQETGGLVVCDWKSYRELEEIPPVL